MSVRQPPPDPIRHEERSNQAMATFPRDVASVASAREWLASFLNSRGVAVRVAKDAALVLSELVTNALRHALGEIVTRSSVADHQVVLSVTDSCGDLPTMLPPDATRIGGMGLRVVDEVADAWGVAAFPGGKTVWAQLNTDGS
jgi:anti-sigma regulatory factor (Ser/Thr protein kinase)